MTDEDKMAEMLLTWEECQEQGHPITPEELCGACPELLDPLRERVRLLANAAWMAKPTDKPRTLAERYSLEKLIGSGGYSQVWRAYDLQLHRHVAVKMPKPSRTLTAVQIEEVLTEARQVARLKHPNIVTVHDVVKDGDGYFIVTDLIEGQTLAERLGLGRMPIAEAVKLLAEIARVIDYAHGQGVIHRDLKPANIFLDHAGRPHVGDFGIARSREELIDGSDGRGTLAYSSPEQLEGKPLDGRSDLWSLGVILFEMLAGRQPFTDENPVRLRQAILVGQLPESPAVPTALMVVCRRCVAKKPDDRFARGCELAAALEATGRSKTSRRWYVLVGFLFPAVVVFLTWQFWLKTTAIENNSPVADNSPTANKANDPTPPSKPVVPTHDDAFRVLRGHEGAVRAVAISADGTLICSGGDDSKVRLCPTEGEATVLEHNGAVTAVRLGRRGSAVLAGTATGTVILWGLPPRTDQERIAGQLRLLSLPIDGPWSLLANCVPMPTAPWKVQTFPAQVGGIKALSISSDGRFVGWVGAEKLEVWEVGGNQPLTIAHTPGETIHYFDFLKDGTLVAAFGYGTEKKLTTRAWVLQKANDRWVASARPSGQNLDLFSDVRGFTISPDRATVLVTQSYAVRVFTKPPKGDGLSLGGSYESPRVLLNASLGLGGDRAITIDQDRMLRFWLLSNQTELATLQGHTKPITALAADASGFLVVTASEDGTIRVWKTP